MKNSDLRDEMLELETYPDDLKGSIREMIDQTRERPLKGWKRLFTAVQCAVVVLFIIGFVTLIIAVIEKIPTMPIYLVGTIPIVMLLLCWLLAVSIRNLIKGTERPRKDLLLIYGVFGFMIYMVVSEMLFGGGVGRDVLAALIIVAVCVICSDIRTAELRQREHLLRTELAIEKLREVNEGRD